MKKHKINNMDVMKWAKEYDGPKFHALLTDSPYNLDTIKKRFGKNGSKPPKGGVYQRSVRGFMNADWDTDIAMQPETWAALGEHLYPGAFGMTFGGSRTAHRIAVAIEDAGFIIHPMIGWVYGSGFPKATNISKQLDKGRVVGQRQDILKKQAKDFERGHRKIKDSYDAGAPDRNNGFKTVSADILDFDDPTAKAWQGHRYGLQALKPAVEPIIVFQKPYEGRPLDNIVETGAGALNIEGGRILTQDEYTINRFDDGAKPFGNGAGHEYTSIKVGRPLRIKTGGASNGIYGDGLNNSKAVGFTSEGRWPANFILDESSAELLDTQTGTLTSGKPSGKKHAANNIYGQYKNEDVDVEGFGDMGGASRFFYQVSTQLDEADPFLYQSKVSPKERNAGLDEMPETLQGSLDGGNDTRNGKNKPQLHPTKNNHPTLKPIALVKYLATLLLPPEEYAPRRILVPFSGVASEMIGCLLAGWEYVEGIEIGKEYCKLGEKRIKYWTHKA